MNKKIMAISIMLVMFAVIMTSQMVAAISRPYGVGGAVTLNGKPIDGLKLKIVDVNTKETKTVTTKYNFAHTACGYFVAFSGSIGQTITISATYGGKTFSNSIKLPNNQLDLSLKV